MNTLGITHSVCSICRQLVPAKIVVKDTKVCFEKFCPTHGLEHSEIYGDVEQYLRNQRYVKPAWTPVEFAGDSSKSCTDGCGLCPRHEQHLCMPIIEITSRCDLNCPVCLVNAGKNSDMTLEELNRIVDGLIRAERQIDVLTISGGEPLIHPRLFDMIDAVMSHSEIIRASISTNGLTLLRNQELLSNLAKRNVVISLQFDGFNDRVYEKLRGRPMLKEKLQILELLANSGITTSLTMTLAGGINEQELEPLLKYFFSQPNIVSLMIQPVAFAGRASEMKKKCNRISIPDVIRLLGSSNIVSTEDFVPLPCSHPLCFSLAFYLMLNDGGRISVNRLVKADGLMDSLCNRTVFGLDEEEHNRIKNLIYELWSGPVGTAPDSQAVLNTLRSIMDEMNCGCFNPKKAFSVAEHRIKSIFIHAFQDVDTFDLARVRRCCNAYPQSDGRLIPACVHNVMGGRA